MPILILVLLLSLGCSTSSGVIQTGPDSFLITREGGNLGSLTTDGIKEAGNYCKEQSKTLQVTATQQHFGLGFDKNSAEVQFMCLNAGDSRLKGGPLMPMNPVNTTIINNK